MRRQKRHTWTSKSVSGKRLAGARLAFTRSRVADVAAIPKEFLVQSPFLKKRSLILKEDTSWRPFIISRLRIPCSQVLKVLLPMPPSVDTSTPASRAAASSR